MECGILLVESALPIRFVVLSASEPDVLSLHHVAIYEFLEAAHPIIGPQHVVIKDCRDLKENHFKRVVNDPVNRNRLVGIDDPADYYSKKAIVAMVAENKPVVQIENKIDVLLSRVRFTFI